MGRAGEVEMGVTIWENSRGRPLRPLVLRGHISHTKFAECGAVLKKIEKLFSCGTVFRTAEWRKKCRLGSVVRGPTCGSAGEPRA